MILTRATDIDDWSQNLLKPCQQFGKNFDESNANNGISFAGEWALAPNDCGLYLNGVLDGARYDGTHRGDTNQVVFGNCSKWTDYQSWTDDFKKNVTSFARVNMDSLKHTFFWTWKIGKSLKTGKVMTPLWDYSLGLEQGWIPKDPYHAGAGACSSVASSLGQSLSPTTAWSKTYDGWKTGASDTPNTANMAQYPWPPATINSVAAAVTALPSYTRTGTLLKAPAPTYTETQQGAKAPSISDWAQDSDSAPMYTKINGCQYFTDQYTVTGIPGNWPCSGGSAPPPTRRMPPIPRATPAPASTPKYKRDA